MTEPSWFHLTAHLAPGTPDLTLEETGGWLWPRLRDAFPEIAACSLMPQHPHVLPRTSDPVAAAQRLARLFGQFGRRFGVPGRISIVADPKHLANRDALARDIRYVVLNPCRAKLVDCPLAWPWSTHRDVVGAIVDPWIRTAELARALGSSANGLAERHHRYVSSDPSVSVVGTPLPRALASSSEPTVPLEWIAAAALAATRRSSRALQCRGDARALFVALAHDQGWRATSQLARMCGCWPHTIRNLARDVDPRMLAVGRLCLADERLRRVPVRSDSMKV